MTALNVTPDYLETLAGKQDAAKGVAAEAAGATSNLTVAVWVTHGVISGCSNAAFSGAEGARRTAGQNLSAAANELAAKLRGAKAAYKGVDSELSGNLKSQMLDQ
ncbi:ESX-1 secretion-associated protein [Mycobacterium europaeum]|uniref:Uncharacterized protein n=1 Tax=Mycobacterium europaeum TaxID=761804 RepID=A0A0U1D3W1_9MYCO|nr:ESX-1 secretion-associated protein [Mycobacterium europaeum]MEA1157765.1 ESX-1 secretion-associated protein [Mycobacterium europaeum]CQD06281.1 hypothetical protein BN000_01247 [Mycobacterium europaeum]